MNIAEATMLTKEMIYNSRTKLRIYEPNSIKMFATDNGNSGKVEMNDKFVSLEEPLLKLDHLPEYKNPREDIIDAYFILKFLQTELKLRYGLLELNTLSLHRVVKISPLRT